MARLTKSTQSNSVTQLVTRIPIDLDTAVAVEAAQRRINKTDVVIEALTNYFKLKETKSA